MRNLLSRLASLGPLRTTAAPDDTNYQKLPSWDLSPDATPMAGSPLSFHSMSKAWRQPSKHLRWARLPRTSPKRLLITTFCVLVTVAVIMAGSMRARENMRRKAAEEEAERNKYHWQHFPR